MYPKLLGIAAIVFGFGLSEALPADDVWKGSWKFETGHQDQPALSYYDTSGRRIFGIACGAHFELDRWQRVLKKSPRATTQLGAANPMSALQVNRRVMAVKATA